MFSVDIEHVTLELHSTPGFDVYKRGDFIARLHTDVSHGLKSEDPDGNLLAYKAQENTLHYYKAIQDAIRYGDPESSWDLEAAGYTRREGDDEWRIYYAVQPEENQIRIRALTQNTKIVPLDESPIEYADLVEHAKRDYRIMNQPPSN